jgi:DNA-directed RNA polymerase subunit K/omega
MSSKNNQRKKKKVDLDDDNDDDPIIESTDSENEENNEDDEKSNQSGGDDETDYEAKQDLSDDEHLDLDQEEETKDPDDGDEEYDPVQEEELAEEDPDEPEEEPEGPEEAGEDFVVESKTCYSKNLNKDNLVMDEDDSNMYAKLEYKRIPDNERETDPIMTYYEIVRIIGTRAQQFNLGAPPLVLGLEGMHPAKMAYIELMAQRTPFIVRRHLPSKKYEEWNIDELQIIHQIDDDFFVPENFDLEAFKKQNNILQQKRQLGTNKKLAKVPESKN